MNLKRSFNVAVWFALTALALIGWVFYDMYQWLWSGV
jgi:hypothetical protein